MNYAKLSAAHAEIERLKAERVAHALRADILETKLSNLRAAAEIAETQIVEWSSKPARMMFLTAIEASK